jgi:hypothetical protein
VQVDSRSVNCKLARIYFVAGKVHQVLLETFVSDTMLPRSVGRGAKFPQLTFLDEAAMAGANAVVSQTGDQRPDEFRKISMCIVSWKRGIRAFPDNRKNM